jgi:L-amino acid N-acyltransferase YncA
LIFGLPDGRFHPILFEIANPGQETTLGHSIATLDIEGTTNLSQRFRWRRPMITVKVMPPETHDLEQLILFHAEAFAETEAMYGQGPPGYNDPAWHAQTLRDHTYFKIVVDDELVGGIIVQDKGAGEIFLHTIFIRPGHQNLGLGSRIIDQLESLFPEARRWTLVTPYRDYRNHHFYEKLGYTKVDEFAATEAGLDPNFVLFKYEKTIEG